MHSVNPQELPGANSRALGPPPGGLTEAMKFWEPRRLVYNLVLAAFAIGWAVATWPHFSAVALFNLFQLAVLAIIANLLYCFAYLAEAALQISKVGGAWTRLRSAIWIIGMVLAALLENYWIADEIYPYVH